MRRCGLERGPVGRVILGATLGPLGNVIASSMKIEGPSAGFASSPTGACVREALRDMRVKAFMGEPVEVRFEAKVEPPREPLHGSGATRAPAEIERAVRERFGDMRACYDDGIRRDVMLTGRVKIRFVINLGGSVANAESIDPDLPDTRVRQCVRRVFETLKFSPNGGVTHVTYPVVLSQ